MMPQRGNLCIASTKQAVRRISLILSLVLAITGIGSSLFATASVVKSGQKCAKAGLKSGSLICVKVKGKPIWQIVKKKQSISVQFPTKTSVSSPGVLITFSTSSGLHVTSTSISPTVCGVNATIVIPIVAGNCVIQLTQAGNAFFLSAPTQKITILIQGMNQITFTPPNSIPLSTGNYQLAGTSSSNLPVVFESLTPSICTIVRSTLTPIKLGTCTVRASQSGSGVFPAAQSVDTSITIQGSNEISFSLPTSLLLSTKTYSLSGTSTSGLALTYESLTPDTCTVSTTILTVTQVGLCTIRASQSGSNLYEPAKHLDASTTISSSRATSDQPDTITGFQIKAIYVVPSDGIDHSYDINGYLAGILNEGNAYLNSQLGLQIPIDRTTAGYDIQFLKSSLSTAEIQTSTDLTTQLLKGSGNLENPSANRKDYIFFIDTSSGLEGTDAAGTGGGAVCGYAGNPGLSAVVALGKSCTGAKNNFSNTETLIWLHELFHNFGVGHTNNSFCDLMSSGTTSCPSNAVVTIDKERTRYVGSSAQGQDILKLPVWEGSTGKNYSASCFLNPVSRADGSKYAYCPTGIQTIGGMSYCWNPIHSVTLEELVNGQWVSLGSGSSNQNPWGPNISWTCGAGFSAPWKQLTVTTPGISLYRWTINGTEIEQFKVIWVR